MLGLNSDTGVLRQAAREGGKCLIRRWKKLVRTAIDQERPNAPTRGRTGIRSQQPRGMHVPFPALVAWVLYSPFPEGMSGRGYIRGGEQWLSPDSPRNLAYFTYRWSMTGSSQFAAGDGLSNSISWALHPSFCEALLPNFPENDMRTLFTFLDCTIMRNAIATAFDTWAMNHRTIAFYDATDECVSELSAVAAEKDEIECSRSEVIIMPSSSSFYEFEYTMDRQVAYVRPHTNSIDWRPRTTGGVYVDGIGMRRAHMVVASKGTCWYLDATFCYAFNQWNRGDGLVRTVLQTTVVFFFTSGILYTAYVAVSIGLAAGGCERRLRMLRNASDDRVSRRLNTDGMSVLGRRIVRMVSTYRHFSTCKIMLSLLSMTSSPIFYYNIFLPCWECYDFEATMAHEVGHLLGFTHPDQMPGMNLRAMRTRNGSCSNPLDAVELAPPEEGVLDTLMTSMTKHRGRTCLTADDLEGLFYLYPPECDGLDNATVAGWKTPKCTKQPRLLGFVRLFFLIFTPYTVLTVLLMSLHCVTTRYYARLTQELEASETHSRAVGMWRKLAFKDRIDRARDPRRAAPNADGSTPRGGMHRIRGRFARLGSAIGGPGGPGAPGVAGGPQRTRTRRALGGLFDITIRAAARKQREEERLQMAIKEQNARSKGQHRRQAPPPGRRQLLSRVPTSAALRHFGSAMRNRTPDETTASRGAGVPPRPAADGSLHIQRQAPRPPLAVSPPPPQMDYTYDQSDHRMEMRDECDVNLPAPKGDATRTRQPLRRCDEAVRSAGHPSRHRLALDLHNVSKPHPPPPYSWPVPVCRIKVFASGPLPLSADCNYHKMASRYPVASAQECPLMRRRQAHPAAARRTARRRCGDVAFESTGWRGR